MTPETLRLDRTFRGVGRIAKATGTTDPTMRRKLSRMLTALYEDGRLDILRAIRDGKLAMLPVYEAYQTRTLDRLPMGATMEPLIATMEAWTDSLEVPRDASAKHVESLTTSRRKFAKHVKGALVSDLPRIVDELRDSLWGRQHPRSFNLARAAAMAFARATLKRTHPIYMALAAIEIRKVAKTTPRHPLTVAEMRAFFPNPDTDWLDGIAWGMAATGMHAKEYWGRWNVLADRVHVGGTKRSGRVRDVPLVKAPVVPKYNRRKFEDDLRERTRAIVVYDLRRTYANWLEAAGIPRTRRKLYMGHGAKDVTDLYEWHEVAAFLMEDGERLRKHLSIPTDPHTIALVAENQA